MWKLYIRVNSLRKYNIFRQYIEQSYKSRETEQKKLRKIWPPKLASSKLRSNIIKGSVNFSEFFICSAISEIIKSLNIIHFEILKCGITQHFNRRNPIRFLQVKCRYNWIILSCRVGGGLQFIFVRYIPFA